jgi:fucose 4-O-acetylase-like acetyltransferase
MGASSDAVAVLIIGFIMILFFFLGGYLAIKEILLESFA